MKAPQVLLHNVQITNFPSIHLKTAFREGISPVQEKPDVLREGILCQAVVFILNNPKEATIVDLEQS